MKSALTTIICCCLLSVTFAQLPGMGLMPGAPGASNMLPFVLSRGSSEGMLHYLLMNLMNQANTGGGGAGSGAGSNQHLLPYLLMRGLSPSEAMPLIFMMSQANAGGAGGGLASNPMLWASILHGGGEHMHKLIPFLIMQQHHQQQQQQAGPAAGGPSSSDPTNQTGSSPGGGPMSSVAPLLLSSTMA